MHHCYACFPTSLTRILSYLTAIHKWLHYLKGLHAVACLIAHFHPHMASYQKHPYMSQSSLSSTHSGLTQKLYAFLHVSILTFVHIWHLTSNIKKWLFLLAEIACSENIFPPCMLKVQARPHREVRPWTNSVVRSIWTPFFRSSELNNLTFTFLPTIVVNQLQTTHCK
jgi:hypothetical protein